MAKQPIVSKVKLSKQLLGGYRLDFDCPGCNGQLNTKDTQIGRNDDCSLCGAVFLISPAIRGQIDAMEAQAVAEQESAEQARKEADARKRVERQKAKIEKLEATAERQREAEQSDHDRGYDYPNLKKYQSHLEATAILGAILFVILGVILLLMALYSMSRNGSWEVALFGILSALGAFGSAAAWYFSWMVAAEMIRLFVTAALDIRAIRDASAPEIQGF